MTKTTDSQANSEELVTPAEHTETTDEVVAASDVATANAPDAAVTDPGVPDDVEIGARSADMAKAGNEHRKAFVLGPNPIDNSSNPYTEAAGFDHEGNKAATRQYMISQGLWPTGDVRHVSTKRHPDGSSWVLTYAVPAIPAHAAPDGSTHPEVVGNDGDAEDALNADATEPTE